MRIWNTVFTGLVHEKSKIELDLERAINADKDATSKTEEVLKILDQYAIIDLKIVKWNEVKEKMMEQLNTQADGNNNSDTE